MRHSLLTLLTLTLVILSSFLAITVTAQQSFYEQASPYEVLRGVTKVALTFQGPRSFEIEELSELSKATLGRVALEAEVRDKLTKAIPIDLDGKTSNGDPGLFVTLDVNKALFLADVYAAKLEMQVYDLVTLEGLDQHVRLAIWNSTGSHLQERPVSGDKIAAMARGLLFQSLDEFIEDWKKANAPN